jgi:hypothetical protein
MVVCHGLRASNEQPGNYVAGELGAGDELAISLNNQQRKSQIRMVAGSVEVIEREEILVAGA